MNRANPVDLRQALEAAHALVNAGVDFVPMPVLDPADKARLIGNMLERVDQIEREAEQS